MTVDDVRRASGGQASAHAKVRVRSLPPDPQGDRTRISWNPWSVSTDGQAFDGALDGPRPRGMFPADKTYAVGDCAVGWLPFPISTDVDKIVYANGVGDRATWDLDDLIRLPFVDGSRAGNFSRSL